MGQFKSNIDSLLNAARLPVLWMTTVDGNEPKGESVYPPEGAWGVGLSGNEYVGGRLVMTIDGKEVYDSGEYVSGGKTGARIKIRGNTSAMQIKKPYKIKLSSKSDLLFRGKEAKEWVLLTAHEIKCIKTITGLIVGEYCGMEWQPGFEFVNVVINGDYKGFYILTDAIEKGVNRCNIANSGFLIEDDAYWWNENVYFKGNLLPFPVGYTFKYPDADDLTDAQLSQIQGYILDFESLLQNKGDIGSMIDIPSWAAWLLAHDILGSGDSGGTNRFLYKYDYDALNPTSTLLKMGILWDFDAAFKKADTFCSIHNVDYSFYFPYLLENAAFIDEYKRKWSEIRSDCHIAVMSRINEVLDNKIEGIDISRKLDRERWGYIFTPIEDDVKIVDEWFIHRLAWLDENIENITGIDEPVEYYDGAKNSIHTVDGISIEKITNPGVYIINGKKVLIKQ